MPKFECKKCDCPYTHTVEGKTAVIFYCDNCNEMVGQIERTEPIEERKPMSNKKKQPRIKVIIDTREQAPLDLAQWDLDVVTKKLPVGDYSIALPDMTHEFTIERKSIDDFVACVTKERDRFMREMKLIRAFKYRAVVCEFSMAMIQDEKYHSKVGKSSVLGTIDRLALMGIPVYLCDDPHSASKRVANLIKMAVSDEVRKAKMFVDQMNLVIQEV